METEVWKTIPFAPDYAASSWGRIMRTAPGKNPMASMAQPGRILRPSARGHKRRYFGLSIIIDGRVSNVNVHRAVCWAFHGPPPTPQHVVAHCDGNGQNNHADNLRWATQSENLADRDLHGTHDRGERNPHAKLTEAAVIAIRSDTRSEEAIGREYGVSQGHINRIKRRQAWAHVA